MEPAPATRAIITTNMEFVSPHSTDQNLSAKKLLKGGLLEADVVVCADDAAAKKQIIDLATAIDGVRGVDGGALANAQMVEGITVLLVSINRNYTTQAGIRIAGIA